MAASRNRYSICALPGVPGGRSLAISAGSTQASAVPVTEREREVLTLIGRGMSNSEIAGHLFISMATVKAHVARLLTKLGARDRVQLVITAYEARLVSVQPGAAWRAHRRSRL